MSTGDPRPHITGRSSVNSLRDSRDGTPHSAERLAVVERPTNHLEELYSAHFRGLTAQVYAYTADLELAQEVVQESFCRAIPRWSRISSYDDPLSWIRRVAFNLATSRWRRARVALSFARRYREEPVAGPGPDRVLLAGALAKLPEKHRRAVVLHHLADLPVADIARTEGVPEGTVRVWLHRGRTALAAQLAEIRTERRYG
jgi:RNA polymerase sigma-70 factor (ECF subfamily)